MITESIKLQILNEIMWVSFIILSRQFLTSVEFFFGWLFLLFFFPVDFFLLLKEQDFLTVEDTK